MRRAVLDTNVIVSSVISRKGAPFQLMEAWEKGGFQLVTSEKIIEETIRVISEPRVKDRFHITDERIQRLKKSLTKNAVFAFGEADVTGTIPDDPSDEKFLSAAILKKASFIVSGDKHLLDLKNFQGITILMPRQFLDSLDAE
ncbi:MAG: putative toxin-antitoxin system toxin component, PIN family [Anaerolineaceae bacterium]|nr:MAG: putative toxin-antitoxin system toxin component, PIN family [Anaerolineaceae bacterium]